MTYSKEHLLNSYLAVYSDLEETSGSEELLKKLESRIDRLQLPDLQEGKVYYISYMNQGFYSLFTSGSFFSGTEKPLISVADVDGWEEVDPDA